MGENNKVAPAAFFTSNSDMGSTQGSFVNKNNTNAPNGTYSHEFIHTLAVPEMGIDKRGGNSPP